MTFKISIAKNSKAAKVLNSFMKQKEDFRKAVESGKVKEYAQENREKFSQPV